MSEPPTPTGGDAPAGADAAPRCYRHPARETWIRCQRCDRPICPDCMVTASVGFQCPECVREGQKATRSGRGAYGGARSSNPLTTSLVLIGVNVFVWLLIVASGGDKGGLFDKLTLMARGRCETPDGGGFYPGVPEQVCSASQFTWVPGVSDGAGWQVVTSMFAHAELWHLASNMLALYFLGPMLESAVGRTRFLAIYLVSGLTGSAMVMALTHPYAQTLGASGAIFGLIGALFVISLKLKVNLQYVGTWLILGLVFSFFGPRDVSWQGHLGGLLGGALVAAIIVYAPRGERRTFVQWSAIGLVVLLTLMAIAARAIALSV